MSEKKSVYRVWFEQVNQTYIDVSAVDEESAKEIAARRWQREYTHQWPSYIEKLVVGKSS